MTQAVLEIFGMLLGALLIGVYFTTRYWKAQYKSKEEEVEKLVAKTAGLAAQVKEQASQLAEQKKALADTTDRYESQLEELKSQSEKDAEMYKTDFELALKEIKKEKEKLQKEVKKDEREIKKLSSVKKELEHEIELKTEELGEKERELEDVSSLFSTHKISYYKQIDGKRYKASTLMEADASVSGKGDGRISKSDAEKVFATISDGHLYTQVEKDTMRYIRQNYNWTPEADVLFRKKVRSWAAKGHQLD